jgi:hypothetical protein
MGLRQKDACRKCYSKRIEKGGENNPNARKCLACGYAWIANHFELFAKDLGKFIDNLAEKMARSRLRPPS